MARRKDATTAPRSAQSINPVQVLNQSVCQKYGWSAEMNQESDGSWSCRVILGRNDQRLFTAPILQAASRPVDEETARKMGQAAVAQVALDGLRDDIARQEAKPICTLHDVFAQPIDVYDSSDTSNWDYFWSHKPTAVGIDTEGNQISPPVLVQIATHDYTILEVPTQGRLSTNVHRLLNDTTIVKVFCDNFNHSDKKCLGIPTDTTIDWTRGHVVDLEAMASHWLGTTKVARGLTRILSLVHCTDVQIRKPAANQRLTSSIQKFCRIEQGKEPPLGSLDDLTPVEQQYAALDAWCTLLVYTRFCEYKGT